MIYLKSFQLADIAKEEAYDHLKCNVYPYGIFPYKKLENIEFSNITMFYGSNGSGKSTLLNIIAEKLNLPRQTPFNSSERFDEYVNRMCSYELTRGENGRKIELPLGSKIITSDDIFNHVIKLRYDNIDINKRKEKAKESFFDAKFNHVNFESLSKYEELKLQNETRQKTMTTFIKERGGINIKMNSNGESALKYFDKQFESGKLYLLDEPENSLAPMFQIQLIKLITECVYYCNCQFIIATHSPFILSIDGAEIYNLDIVPARVQKWFELDSVRLYYEFFKDNEKFFE